MTVTNATDTRLSDLIRFYSLLEQLEHVCDGFRLLCDCSGYKNWPRRGVYFFREPGEFRTDTGSGLRVVRIGTHALTNGNLTTLWGRLSQHKGVAKSGAGNHRSSIFREIVGASLIKKNKYNFEVWGQKNKAEASAAVRKDEEKLEKEVSIIIGRMPFLWLAVEDSPSPDSLRGYVERNAIALLSNFGKAAIDAPSKHWLGYFCDKEKVRKSGLWNQKHVDEAYDPMFINELERLISEMANKNNQ